MTLTQIQKDLLVGTLLGDGNLQTNNGQVWRYRAIHKALHFLYIDHKYTVMKDFCKSPPVYSEVVDGRTNQTYKRYSFNTTFQSEFRFYGQKFYTEEKGIWKKQVPKDIKKYLTPRALAYWYMDDGALKWKGKSNAVRLCTDGFQKYEVERLGEVLRSNFDLKISYQKKDTFLRISIAEESYSQLRSIILEHLQPCMYYKFPDGNKGVYNNDDIANDIINTFDKRR
jgi:hypothetical protein